MFVYFIRNEVTRNVKIGCSNDPEQRLRFLQQGSDCRLTLVAQLEADEAVERRLHDKWHQYRLYDEGTAGQEWFSIDVKPNGKGGVKITGRKKQRPPKRRSDRGKRRHQLCLRLSDRQMELLERYVTLRHFESGVEALRFMIDGLEDWLARQTAKQAIAGSPAEDESPRASHTSDVGPGTDVTRRSDVAPPKRDLGENSRESRVGDFAGRPSVGLPEPHWNDGNSD